MTHNLTRSIGIVVRCAVLAGASVAFGACERATTTGAIAPKPSPVAAVASDELRRALGIEDFVTSAYMKGRAGCDSHAASGNRITHVAAALPDGSGFEVLSHRNSNGELVRAQVTRGWPNEGRIIVAVTANQVHVARSNGTSENGPVSAPVAALVRRLAEQAEKVSCAG